MDASERRYTDAVKILRSLELAGYAARLAGGCVRDRLLGREPVDFDVATDARPEQVLHIFRTEERTTVPTGIKHGTVTVVMPSGPVEITTLRKDVETDGRHAEVAFGKSFKVDAERRDFTINAMYAGASGEIYDEVGGRADLAARALRFVGEPAARIKEDYLRVLRLFRFWAVLGMAPAAGTLPVVAAHRDGLRGLSQERISRELLKLCEGVDAAEALAGMVATGVWAVIMPECPGPLPSDALLRRWAQEVGRGRRGLAVLIGICLNNEHLDAVKAEVLAQRLKLSSREVKSLVFGFLGRDQLREPMPDIAARLDFVDRAEEADGPGALSELYQPLWEGPGLAAVVDAERAFGHLRRAALPVTGRDLIKDLGMRPGPDLGLRLDELKRAYRNGQWRTREEGLAWALRLQVGVGG